MSSRRVDPEAQAYEQAFRDWAQGVIQRLAEQKPWLPAPCLEDFDGCSYVPDNSLWSCLIHDVRYHYVETRLERLEADRDLRDDILSMTLGDPAWHWLWWARAWAVYVGVRLFGWIWAGRGDQMGLDPEPPAVITTDTRP